MVSINEMRIKLVLEYIDKRLERIKFLENEQDNLLSKEFLLFSKNELEAIREILLFKP